MLCGVGDGVFVRNVMWRGRRCICKKCCVIETCKFVTDCFNITEPSEFLRNILFHGKRWICKTYSVSWQFVSLYEICCYGNPYICDRYSIRRESVNLEQIFHTMCNCGFVISILYDGNLWICKKYIVMGTHKFLTDSSVDKL